MTGLFSRSFVISAGVVTGAAVAVGVIVGVARAADRLLSGWLL